jgi:hypothetical protein
VTRAFWIFAIAFAVLCTAITVVSWFAMGWGWGIAFLVGLPIFYVVGKGGRLVLQAAGVRSGAPMAAASLRRSRAWRTEGGHSRGYAVVRVVLLGLVVAAMLLVSGCRDFHGGLSRQEARDKATEIVGDVHDVLRRGRFEYLGVAKARLKGREAWKAQFYWLTPADPREGGGTHPPPLFCVYVWGEGSTVRVDGSGKNGC